MAGAMDAASGDDMDEDGYHSQRVPARASSQAGPPGLESLQWDEPIVEAPKEYVFIFEKVML